MIKTTKLLIKEYSNFVNPAGKIARDVRDGRLVSISRGIYETQSNSDGKYYANCICAPSYLSFDYALFYYGLIPEAVYTYTSATYAKRRKKEFNNYFGRYTYQDVPSSIYSYGIEIIYEGEYSYMIASREKALCDKLYTLRTLKNQSEMQKLLFEDLRIDEHELDKMSIQDIEILAKEYRCVNVKLLAAYIKRRNK